MLRPLKLSVWGLALSAVVAISAQDAPLHYLAPGQPDLIAVLSPPPVPGSAEQDADLAAVIAIHQTCASNQTALALAEKKFTVFSFSPVLGPFFQPGRLPKTEALLARALTDAEVVTGQAKQYWRRPRPYTLDPSLAAGKLEKSFSYPSGHSTEATVLALVLADLFPVQREDILAISRDIGWHRVLIARHYPTDIYAGRVFAQAIVRQMKSNPEFRHDFDAAKSEIAAIR